MDPISRMERILSGEALEPITRIEKFCAMAAGTYSGDPLVPTSRLEYFLSQISGGGGGGGDVTITDLVVTPTWFGTLTPHFTYPLLQVFEDENVAYNPVKYSDEAIGLLSFQNVISHGASSSFPAYDSMVAHQTELRSYIVRNSTLPLRNYTFDGCSKLDTLVILGNSVCNLAGISAFNNTPFASGKSGGTLYVPESLIPSYQSATNWATILSYPNNRITKIEGSEWEGAT